MTTKHDVVRRVELTTYQIDLIYQTVRTRAESTSYDKETLAARHLRDLLDATTKVTLEVQDGTR